MPPPVDVPYLDTIERKRLKTNYTRLKGDAKGVKQAAIADLDNSDIIAILKFGYNALELSEVIPNSATFHAKLAEAEEHEIRDFKVTHESWIVLLQDRAKSLQRGDQNRRRK